MLTLEQQLSLHRMKADVNNISHQELEEMLEQTLRQLKIKEKTLNYLSESGRMPALDPVLFTLSFTERADMVKRLDDCRAFPKEQLAEELINVMTAMMVKDNAIKDKLKPIAA